MDAPQWNGSDPRSLSGRPATISQLFWQAYEYAVRHDCVDEFLSVYRPMPVFAELVAEVDRREAVRLGD